MGLKLEMCQFAAIKEAQRGLTIVEELGLSLDVPVLPSEKSAII